MTRSAEWGRAGIPRSGDVGYDRWIAGSGTATPIRVFVADDHPVFRDALGRSVNAHPRLELIGSAGDGRDALEQLRALEPDVALLDYRLPSLDGLEILRAIQQEGRTTRVVMLTGDGSSESVYDAVTLGAAGYLTKASTIDDIYAAIIGAAAGETVLAPAAQAGLVEQLRARELGERPALSTRETEILRLIADGLASPEIATRLSIKPSTVKTHVGNLFEKLGVNDRAAAVADAMRRGLLD
jgi:two-component system nitrate/nitrite response regulator NarL